MKIKDLRKIIEHRTKLIHSTIEVIPSPELNNQIKVWWNDIIDAEISILELRRKSINEGFNN